MLLSRIVLIPVVLLSFFLFYYRVLSDLMTPFLKGLFMGTICEDSGVSASTFYSAITELYNNRSYLGLISTIYNNLSNLYSIYYPTSWSSNQWVKWFVCCWRCLFSSVVFCFYYAVSIFLTFFYQRLFWGSQSLLDICGTGSGVSYSIYLLFYEAVGFSQANLHFEYTFTSTSFSELPESIATIIPNVEDAVLDTYEELGFTITFNLSNLDLSKLPIFKKPEV